MHPLSREEMLESLPFDKKGHADQLTTMYRKGYSIPWLMIDDIKLRPIYGQSVYQGLIEQR